MTFHPRSVVEFGRFFTRLSESLESGAPLGHAVELIRQQLRGVAAALRIEDRQTPGHGPVIVAEAPGAGRDRSSPLAHDARLAELLESRRHVAATAVGDDDGDRFTLWLFRDLRDPGFDAEEEAMCEIMVAQLRRGLALTKRIGANEIERALYSGVMDKLSVGVVILDLSGRVVKCSAKAEESLAARDGLQLQAGRLRATCAKEDRDLQAAIRTALQAAAGGEAAPSRGLSVTRLSGNRNLGVIVQTVQDAKNVGAPSAVAIYIRDPEANADVESDLVRQLFDLTPAEAAVARRLTAGLSLEDAASSLDISRNTARAHLRSIFSKSGITRQTELVRLMLNSAAVLGERPRRAA
jgi:DNA-binding CsgD family transcriptional regulator/PAS domain-containing protein